MQKRDIKRHLQNYSIFNKRKTTINHAFASALSVADLYDESRIDSALKSLGQEPNEDLLCVYCTKPAETWDHIMAVVKNGKFSGYGHQIGNLLPCCKECNSKKGNKDWREFLLSKRPEESVTPDITNRIEHYIAANRSELEHLMDDEITNEINKLDAIKFEIFDLMKKADVQADLIRRKLQQKLG